MPKINFDQYNDEVKAWAAQMRSTMLATGTSMGIQHRANSTNPVASLTRLKNSFKYDTGAIEVIGFQFPRSLIYPHYGAGKGMGGNSGSSWIDRHGTRQTAKPTSTGKMGTGTRRPKPWFARPMGGATGLEALADLAAKNIGATVTEHILK